jgi:hypothetical protein
MISFILFFHLEFIQEISFKLIFLNPDLNDKRKINLFLSFPRFRKSEK